MGKHKKLKKLLKSLKGSTMDYCRNTTLHGFRHIAAENATLHERIFWLIVCFSGALMTIVMFCALWKRYQISPTMTTIETNNYPIKNVPFPALTICNLNKVKRSSFELMAEKFQEHGVQRVVLKRYLKRLLHVRHKKTTSFEQENAVHNVMYKLGYSVESLMFDLSQPCSQFLVRCMWLDKEYNCSRLFNEVKTPEGFCCSFNWRGPKISLYQNITLREFWKDQNPLFDPMEKYLYVSDASTPSAGLRVVVDVDENNFFGSTDSFLGSVVILHSSLQYPDIDSPRAYVQPRCDATVRLRASITESSKDVRSLKVHQRQCYFDDEIFMRTDSHYTYEACTLECKLHTFKKLCGCIPFVYPNIVNAKICTLSDMKCINEYRVLANQDTETATEEWDTLPPDDHCRCLPSCNDVNYDWFIQVNEIRNTAYASFMFNKNLSNKSAISIFFEQNVCMKYRIDSQLTWDSVIASFGGILGLCLGGSMISMIESWYFFFYDIIKIYEGEFRNKVTRKSKKIKKLPTKSIKVIPLMIGDSPMDIQYSFSEEDLPWIE